THFQWIHLHESEFPPFPSSDVGYLIRELEKAEVDLYGNSRLFMLLSGVHRTILITLILSDSFLDCLPRGARILPRRILTRASTILHFAQVEIEGEQDVDKKWQSFAF